MSTTPGMRCSDMTVTTTVRSWGAILLGGIFALGTAYVLFADVQFNLKDANGKTPLQYARDAGHPELITRLLEGARYREGHFSTGSGATPQPDDTYSDSPSQRA